MKKYSLLILLAIAALGVKAQNRKNIINFSQVQQYFNPAFTGHEGSVLKSFYRNQWTGFEGAPRTLFVSAELDLADFVAWRDGNMAVEPAVTNNSLLGAKNALGISLLHDSFGPFRESQVFMNYSSRVRLSEKLALRAGAGISYNFTSLDYTSLTMDQESDPEYQDLIISDNKADKVDVNVGIMLTAEDYYLGYSLQDATKGKILSENDYYYRTFETQHVVQAGYRKGLSDQFGVVVNGMYRYDAKLKESVEAQVKGVFNNTVWVGAGYRQNLAYSLMAGALLNKVKIGYAYEAATGNAHGINKGSNEIMLTYNLVPLKNKQSGKKLSIW